RRMVIAQLRRGKGKDSTEPCSGRGEALRRTTVSSPNPSENWPVITAGSRSRRPAPARRSAGARSMTWWRIPVAAYRRPGGGLLARRRRRHRGIVFRDEVLDELRRPVRRAAPFHGPVGL